MRHSRILALGAVVWVSGMTAVRAGGAALTEFVTDNFHGAGNCAMCHSKRIDSTGADVSMDAQWRSTMMANAAKDPLWQAKMSSEITRLPELESVIEDKCSRCHMPMARVQAVTDGVEVAVFGDGFMDKTHYLHRAAMDGVSCSLCHQIQDSGLGEPGSFTGGYVIGTSLPGPDRPMFGPFDNMFANPMQMHVNSTPTQGLHVKSSELCATCHTLYTPIVDAGGNVIGEFPEQTPYLEWERSAFAPGADNHAECQDCHMPAAAGAVAISDRPRWLTPLPGIGQHHFVGGNALMLGILKDNAPEIGLTAEVTHMDATRSLTTGQLGTDAASLSIAGAAVGQGVLDVALEVANHSGHKFPTGVPIRRAWVHLVVTDRLGAVVFESGRVEADGRIVGNDADDDAANCEPHHETITSADQVQIYESIAADSGGNVTYTFLRAAGYVKDNRLLPRGFDKDSAPADVAVYGSAVVDADFVAGTDWVNYRVDVQGRAKPLTVRAQLLYQSASHRFVEDLRQDATDAVARFASYYDAADKAPVTVASAVAVIGTDFIDFPDFAAQWRSSGCAEPTWCGGADFDHDGRVDFVDMMLFAGSWLAGH